jgi:hypothetical protein
MTFDATDVHELVRRYDIRWHTGPEQAVVAGALRTIGLRLELTALHDHPRHEPTAGCPECRPVQAALERVIEAVLPRDHRRSHYEVSLPPAKLEFTRSGVPEISASITILHNEAVNDPIDACESRCLGEMTSRLKQLGAREGGH